jgi:hypothetical protein
MCWKTLDSLLGEYDRANSSNQQVCNKMEFVFPVIDCPWTFYNRFYSKIVLGPIDNSNQDITIRQAKQKRLSRKRYCRRLRMPSCNSTIKTNAWKLRVPSSNSTIKANA